VSSASGKFSTRICFTATNPPGMKRKRKKKRNRKRKRKEEKKKKRRKGKKKEKGFKINETH